MPLNTNYSKDKSLVALLCQHLVGLHVAIGLPAEEKEQSPVRNLIFAGTLIFIRNALVYITAGHNLSEIERAKSNGARIISASLVDTFGRATRSFEPIPFDLESEVLYFVDAPEQGLDFGAIIIKPYYERLLRFNGVIALEEKNWKYQGKIEFDHYAALGLPEELASLDGNKSEGCHATAALVPLTIPDQVPPKVHEMSYRPFVGKIITIGDLASLRGMSGGPIFGFTSEPPEKYWVVALGCMWNPQDQLLYGCDIPTLASMMTDWADGKTV